MTDLTSPILLLRPQQIEFGIGQAGAVGRWASTAGFTRTLVVADAFNADRIDVLKLPGAVSVFSKISAEPEIADLELLLGVARGAPFDLVVGFGGGSAMDLAKLAAALIDEVGDIHDFVGAGKIATRRRIGLAQLPTTAGTGSEVGIRALVTDPETSAKLAVESVQMLADFVAIDPALTFSVPPKVTAATGIDAMAHCVEAYTSRKAHPIIDFYAVEGIRLVGRYLGRAVRDGEDAEARAALSLAALHGGYCLGPVNTAGGHALSYPLGTDWKIPHGAANALIFPHVLAFNAPAVADKTRLVLEALGCNGSTDPDAVLAEAHGFCSGLGLQMKLSEWGVDPASLPKMARAAVQIRRLLDNNPRELTEPDILAIYETSA
jgi:alcohol dehydrogenase